MQTVIKTALLCPLLIICLLAAGPALADDALLGGWELVTVGDNEFGEHDQRVVYVFGQEVVHVTFESAGESMTWELAYTVSEGELTLEPQPGLGEPAPFTCAYEVTDGKLILHRKAPDGTELPDLTFARPTN